MCQSFGFLCHVCVTASLCSLSLLAVDRYRVVVCRRGLSSAYVRGFFASAWLLGLLHGSVAFMPSGGSFALDGVGAACYTRLELSPLSVFTAVLLVFSLIVVSTCYSLIYCHVQRATQTRMPKALAAARGMLAVSVVFALTWAPFVVQLFWGMAATGSVPHWLNGLAVLAVGSGFITQPLIILFYFAPLRRAVFRTCIYLCGCCCRVSCADRGAGSVGPRAHLLAASATAGIADDADDARSPIERMPQFAGDASFSEEDEEDGSLAGGAPIVPRRSSGRLAPPTRIGGMLA